MARMAGGSQVRAAAIDQGGSQETGGSVQIVGVFWSCCQQDLQIDETRTTLRFLV